MESVSMDDGVGVAKTGRIVSIEPRVRKPRGKIAAKDRAPAVEKIAGSMSDAASIREEDRVIAVAKTSGGMSDSRSSCAEDRMTFVEKTERRASDAQTIDGADREKADEKSSERMSVTVELLRQLQRRRRFAIKMQSKIDRGTDAYLAMQFGYHTGLPEKERKAIFTRVGQLRRAVEKGEEGRLENVEKTSPSSSSSPDLSLYATTILAAAASRRAFDGIRDATEKEMRRAAKSLPVWRFASAVRGLGELGVAIVVGEAGDLGAYPSKAHLWKRLGLAVINGERQQRKSGAEMAAAHGYSPHRRSEMWVLSDSMLRSQLRKQDDETTIAAGEYGARYLRRRADTSQREWTKGHSHDDARRYMWKAVLTHLRAAWRATDARDA